MMTAGHDAPIPPRNLNMTNAGKFGASAHASMKVVKNAKAQRLTCFLPYCSVMGPKNGPTQYPTIQIEVGSTRRYGDVMPNSRPKNSAALDDNPLAVAEFMTPRP